MALANYTFPLLIFYGCWFIFFLSWVYVVTDKMWKAIIASLSVVFVVSEYYEIPILILDYLTLRLPNVLHHFIVFIFFMFFLSIVKVKWNKTTIGLLILTSFSTALILYGTPNLIYLARFMGFIPFLYMVATSSEGVGGNNVSNKP